MRITVIGPAYPLRGGVSHHVYCLTENLRKRGNTVQLISFHKLYPNLLFPGTTEIDHSSVKLDAGGEALLSPLNPGTWRKAFRSIQTHAPAVVVLQWWQPFFAPMVGTLIRKLHKKAIRCLVECHNVVPHESNPLDHGLTRFALRRADAFITHSENDRNELLKIVSGKKIGVAPLPVANVFLGATPQKRDGRTILFFGKVRKYKGLEVLLAAMPKVLSKVDCHLMVVGEFYESVEKYRDLIHKLGLADHVTIDDRYVSNEEVTGIFQRADVLVLPYLSASQSAVAQIASANALPIIASKCGGLSEVVTENTNGLLFPPGDAEALADKLIDYFTNELGPQFAENQRSAAVDNRERLSELIEQLAQADVGNRTS